MSVPRLGPGTGLRDGRRARGRGRERHPRGSAPLAPAGGKAMRASVILEHLRDRPKRLERRFLVRAR